MKNKIKFLAILTRFLCLILLMNLIRCTPAIAQDQYFQKEKQILIKKNEAAKFDGVLVPEGIYRSMHKDIFQKQLLESEIDMCFDKLNDDSKFDKYKYATGGFLIGVLSSALIAWAVRER